METVSGEALSCLVTKCSVTSYQLFLKNCIVNSWQNCVSQCWHKLNRELSSELVGVFRHQALSVSELAQNGSSILLGGQGCISDINIALGLGIALTTFST